MYYRLKTGRIVKESDVDLAYEIVKGRTIHDDFHDFRKWLKFLGNEPIGDDEITIQDLVSGGCIIAAVVKYRDDNGCALSEAKKKIDEMIANGKVEQK